jgi:hypothetical protein
MAPLIFFNFSFGYFIHDDFLVESGDSSNDPRVLLKEEITWVLSILRIVYSFSFISYSELEETTASFPKFVADLH